MAIAKDAKASAAFFAPSPPQDRETTKPSASRKHNLAPKPQLKILKGVSLLGLYPLPK